MNELQWIIVNQKTAHPLNERTYTSERDATTTLFRLGEIFAELYRAVPLYEDVRWSRILIEGLHAGDLDGIMLPQFSVDVYVPSDPKTDNIVFGFMIKGVPEAVYPFRNFCRYSRGVSTVDYGDSDTLPNTSIVYVEFDRAKFELNEFFDLIEQVCRLSGFQPNDLSVNFPTSNKSFPYSVETIKDYFGKRDRDKNRLAQYKANKERSKQIQKELEQELDFGNIGKRLRSSNPNSQNAKPDSRVHGLRHLKHLARPSGSKKPQVQTEIEIPDTVKASIIADAKRNRTNHQLKWADFDLRWSQRLHVTPNKVSSIRKAIYDSP